MSQTTADLLHQVEQMVGQRDIEGAPMLKYNPTRAHILALWERLTAYDEWRRALLERYRDNEMVGDLLVGGPRFPKGA